LNALALQNMNVVSVTPGGSAVGTEVRWVAPSNAPRRLVIPRSPNDATAVIPELPTSAVQYPGRYPKWVAAPEIDTVWSPGLVYVCVSDAFVVPSPQSTVTDPPVSGKSSVLPPRVVL
jgi:hypothetical protein